MPNVTTAVLEKLGQLEMDTLYEFADQELEADRNFYSRVPELHGFNPFDWTREQVIQFTVDNGHDVESVISWPRRNMVH